MPGVLTHLPSVSELLESAPLQSLVARVNRNVIVSRVRTFLDGMRAQVQTAAASTHVPSASELAQRIAEWITIQEQAAWRPVINATGIVIHRHLGNAPLADEALAAIADIGRGYASIEFDLATGEPAERLLNIQRLVAQLAGAESGIVVNSFSGGALLIFAALARGREVVIARSQVGELDDDFRLPEIVAESGAILREVGSANIIRISDYVAAMSGQTAVFLQARPTDYALVGRTRDVPLAELVALGHKRGVTVIDLLGSGGLIDPARFGIRGETTVGESIRAGADLVLFCGEKLVGGPPCGIIVGRRQLIDSLGQHPLARMVRADKLTATALAATLRIYQDGEIAERSIPVLSLLATPLANLQHRAERLAPQLAATGLASVAIVPGQAYLHGEPVPGQSMATVRLVLRPRSGSAEELGAALRRGVPSVIGLVEKDELLLDLRSVHPRDDAELVAALSAQRPQASETTPASPA